MTDFNTLKAELEAKRVTLVAVSKTKPVEQIRDIYVLGQRIFGENRVSELVEKFPAMPADTEWHMIGHLQSKKVRVIAHFFSMIHSVDSEKLLKVIDKEGARNNRVIDVLLQFKIASEETKYGLDFNVFRASYSPRFFTDLENVRVRGVMGMASFVNDEAQIRSEFNKLKGYFEVLKSEMFTSEDFDVRSYGMSGDYEIAIETGSNMVRIGSLIFGSRN